MRRLDASEVEAIARDLNLSADELNALAQSVPTSLKPLKQRLAYAGTSERELAASDCAVLRDLQRVCSQCSAKARCAADLEQGRRAGPAKYCPNEQTLRALACEAWEPPSARLVSFPVARA
jgi:CelD/BcsL family acetyltransferase involved in cellulose biosynthesis